MPSLAKKIVEISKLEVGVEEIGNTNCGPRVNEYKAATWLPPKKAWPWCAAFVDWVVMEAMKSDGPYTFRRPRTAGAWALEDWSLDQDDSTHTKKSPGADIMAGDIIIFRFSHCGFAASSPIGDGMFRSYEGNTDGAGSREGGGVFAKVRKLSLVRSRIRFTC